jgi:hypothetical protein
MLLCMLCASALAAQAPDSQARRILDQPSYKGYRVERPEPGRDSGNWDGESGSSGEYSGGAGEGVNRFRRTGEGEGRRASRAGPGGDRGSGGSLPDLGWLVPLFEVVIWVVVIAAVLAGVYFLVRAILGIKRDRRKAAKKRAEKTEKKKPVAETPDAPGEPAAVLDEPFADALEIALREYDKAVASRQWGLAALLAYRIFWLRAGWPGCVEETDVRTWRDAVRMVRTPDLRQRVRGLLRMVESVRYGEHTPGPEEFTAWRGELDALNPREALR